MCKKETIIVFYRDTEVSSEKVLPSLLEQYIRQKSVQKVFSIKKCNVGNWGN